MSVVTPATRKRAASRGSAASASRIGAGSARPVVSRMTRANGAILANVAPVDEIVEPVDQVAAQRAAQAAGIERNDFAFDRLEQQMVEADLAPFVDDH